MEKYPFMPYKDKYMVVVDIKALKNYLEAKKEAKKNDNDVKDKKDIKK